MDDFEKIVEEGKRSAQKAGRVATEERKDVKDSARLAELGEAAARNAQSLWEETKHRTRRAGEQLGDNWERFSGSAQDYAREHSIGVAVGSLGVGLLLGVAVGLLIRRD